MQDCCLSNVDDKFKQRSIATFKELNHVLKAKDNDDIKDISKLQLQHEDDECDFELSTMPTKHFLCRRSADTKHWTEYTLKDVDELDSASNQSVALAFLSCLRKTTDVNNTDDSTTNVRRKRRNEVVATEETEETAKVALEHLVNMDEVGGIFDDENDSNKEKCKRQRCYRKN
ncbi:hypothetical protein GJ496_009229 [Pomphorhynchus laevis]|nr:hypothetical protein GJ496_009229 [Pomphorhynchus laevis]